MEIIIFFLFDAVSYKSYSDKDILTTKDLIEKENYSLVLFDRHLLLQYFTFSQSFSHFFLHVNGLLQTIHVLVGRGFFILQFNIFLD